MIDWWTVSFQIINFIILLVILRFLLYKPVLRAMDAREKRIADHLRQAREKSEQAEHERQEFERKNRQIEDQREQQRQEARSQADEYRQSLEDQARQNIDDRKRQWRQSMESQQEDFLRGLRRQAGEKLCAVARRALGDLADADLEQQVAETFRRRVESLGDDEHADILKAIGEADEPIHVHSSWDLGDPRKQSLREALRSRLGGDRAVEFQTDRAVVCGVELRCAGQAMGWSVRSYVDQIVETLDRALREAEASDGQSAEERED